MNISPAVQARMNELREKEAAAKAQEEFLKQELIKGIATEVSLKSDDWEAELLFEIEKTHCFTDWLRKKIKTAAEPAPTCRKPYFNTPDGKQPFYRSGYHDMSDGKRKIIAIPHYNIHETAEIIIAGIPVPAEYTLENERMRIRYRVLTHVINSVKATMKEEERVANLKAAEEARIAAEEKAIAAAAAAKAAEVRSMVAGKLYAENFRKTIKSPWHSFTDVDSIESRTLYVVYDEKSKVLQLCVYHRPDVTIAYSYTTPAHLNAPVSWNGLYEKGQLPFLTCCPVCTRQITLRCRRVDEWGHYASDIASVGCVENHYRWDPATNQHWRSDWPGQWNPRDPDGSIAARIKLEKIITEKEIELQQLKVQLAALKKT